MKLHKRIKYNQSLIQSNRSSDYHSLQDCKTDEMENLGPAPEFRPVFDKNQPVEAQAKSISREDMDLAFQQMMAERERQNSEIQEQSKSRHQNPMFKAEIEPLTSREKMDFVFQRMMAERQRQNSEDQTKTKPDIKKHSFTFTSMWY